MKVYDLIRQLSELSHTGDQEIGIVMMDGHNNPFVTTDFSIETVMVNNGQIVYDDEDKGENVVVIGI